MAPRTMPVRSTSSLRSPATLAAFAALAALFVAACGGSNAGEPADGVTFWQDVAPIYNAKCVACHQPDGIAPFRLDTYADAKANAAAELAEVTAGAMPPYFMVHDGSCGSFHDDKTLTADEKATITRWVDEGQREGKPATLTRPLRPQLAGALDIATPAFSPVAQGGQLAEFDEYRCFLLDQPAGAGPFLTGYDVLPGEPSIVHHVIGFVVDPQAPGSDGSGDTNAAIMQALDDESPDRLGWPCFGAAGEGVDVDGVPVTWAPGQGVIEYPDGMGLAIKPTDKLVVQVHYNLADPGSGGKTDKTTIHLRYGQSVTRRLAFLLPDPFLDSLHRATPDSLPAGQTSATYSWSRTGTGLGIGAADLIAVLPHMHGRGVSQTLELGPAGNLSCAARLENWDFHWQEIYFYKERPALTGSTQFKVTCTYDTSADTAPVMPGWGTRNEMCLAGMMIALPAGN